MLCPVVHSGKNTIGSKIHALRRYLTRMLNIKRSSDNNIVTDIYGNTNKQNTRANG